MEVIYKTFDGKCFGTAKEALDYEKSREREVLIVERTKLVRECSLLKTSVFKSIERFINEIDMFIKLDPYYLQFHFPEFIIPGVANSLREIKETCKNWKVGRSDKRALLKIHLKIARSKYQKKLKENKKKIAFISTKLRALNSK